jgi:predicted extracellular nuclease
MNKRSTLPLYASIFLHSLRPPTGARPPEDQHHCTTMKSLSTLVLALLLVSCGAREKSARGQGSDRSTGADRRKIETPVDRPRPDDSLTIAFYNVENLFDTEDDPANPGDDEYTPQGRLRWTPERLDKKLEDLARAIRAIGGYQGPDLLGVCEVENRDVLERLVSEFLPEGVYDVAHADSPDERGIDVALIYRKSAMTFRGMFNHPIDLGGGDRTRDILEVVFEREGKQFTVLVNHWPSRSGGEARSASKRERAAEKAAEIITHTTNADPAADIILMGDLNDEPFNESVEEVLRALPFSVHFDGRLINTAAPIAAVDTIGSYYFQRDWETIDQICLSRGALDEKGIVLYQTTQTVFTPDFLRDDRADRDARPPYRTFKGQQYIAGTSDHFPVYLRVGWR